MEGLLPQEILQRKKSPYPKTFDPKYGYLVSSMLGRLLDDANAPIWQLVDPKLAAELISGEYPWPWYGQLMRGPQTVAYLLQINFWLKEYRVDLLF